MARFIEIMTREGVSIYININSIMYLDCGFNEYGEECVFIYLVDGSRISSIETYDALSDLIHKVTTEN